MFPKSPVTWSLQSTDNVKKWLQTCIAGHTKCRVSRTSTISSHRFLPIRLLDAGTTESGRPSPESIDAKFTFSLPEIRLCRSDSLSQDIEYLTLSHRWGKPQGFTLNNGTLSEFHESITQAELLSPQAMTFKNAIHITRCLGFRYLWIDALCINQDDPREKASEIAHMGEIYSNSTLNISATGAFLPSEGMFFERKVLSVVPCQQQVGFRKSRKQVAGVLTAYTCRWLENVDSAPLHDRGWVYQERILAPRILHFARDQIFWECASLQASETFPYGNSHLSSPYNGYLKTWYLNDSSFRQAPLQTVRTTWAMLISAYSGTSLTLPEDKLVAFSAVARKFGAFSKFLDSDYAAGLWRPDLAWQLLWTVIDPWTNKAEPATYRSPSWSWASISTGSVLWFLQDRGEIVVNVQYVCVYPKTDDTFGEIVGGSIRLQGPMCRFRRLALHDGTGFVLRANGKSFPSELISINWDDVREGFLDLSHHAQQSLIPENLYCVAFKLHDEEPGRTDGMSGLILEPVGGLKGHYRRIGHFSASEDKASWDADFRDCFAAGTLGFIDFLEFDGSDAYTIAII